MSTTLFRLDMSDNKLTAVPRRSLYELGKTEAGDLESWLASSGEGLFGRQVLWIARQDRPSEEQRSDLVGVDKEGNLLVTELKRGLVAEDAVTQALSYAAEYAQKTVEDLTEIFANQKDTKSSRGLISSVASPEDAEQALSKHVGADTEVNESQIIILVGEDFSPKALAICDYLNESSGEATFSIECWKYGVFNPIPEEHYFALEQILPPPSVRDAIEEKREASKSRKYARDPVRREFMWTLLNFLVGKAVTGTRSRGQSYECRLKQNSWTFPHDVFLSVHAEHPKLILPPGLCFEAQTDLPHINKGKQWDGKEVLEFVDVDLRNVKFTDTFGERLIKVVEALKETPIAQ